MSAIQSSELDEQLSTPQFHENPYLLYHQFRQHAPVHWSDAWECWLLTRYDDVNLSLRDSKRFSSFFPVPLSLIATTHSLSLH